MAQPNPTIFVATLRAFSVRAQADNETTISVLLGAMMGLSGSVAIVLYVRARRREVQHGRVATPRIIQRQLELQLPWGRPDEASVASRAETPGVEAASRSVRDAAPEPDPDEGYVRVASAAF